MSNRYSKAFHLQVLFCFFFILGFSSVVKSDVVAVFYALDADLKTLKNGAKNVLNPLLVGTRSLDRMKIGNHDVIAVKMGSGCVETTLSAQALLSRFRCDLAISVGPAGALASSVETGRWYNVENLSFWQKGTETTEGFMHNDKSDVVLKRASLLLESAPDPVWRDPPVKLTSGEAFIASQSAKERLHLSTGAALVDMNSFGLAAACTDHGTPLYILRVVSDGADEAAGEIFRSFVAAYDGEGGKMITRFITSLPPNPESPESYEAIRKLMEKER